jgi:hypothetical protein
MKRIIAALALVLLSVPAFAQSRPTEARGKDKTVSFDGDYIVSELPGPLIEDYSDRTRPTTITLIPKRVSFVDLIIRSAESL